MHLLLCARFVQQIAPISRATITHLVIAFVKECIFKTTVFLKYNGKRSVKSKLQLYTKYIFIYRSHLTGNWMSKISISSYQSCLPWHPDNSSWLTRSCRFLQVSRRTPNLSTVCTHWTGWHVNNLCNLTRLATVKPLPTFKPNEHKNCHNHCVAMFIYRVVIKKKS